MRKLASIQKIKETKPIEGADRIELAVVLGWQVVIKKGEFKPGDLCVYFEIDSFLPIEDERFAFLKDSSYKNSDLLGEGYRLKTQKLRGQISQGLCLSVEQFPELWSSTESHRNSIGPKEGQDVTELLNVRKWEVPEMATTGGTVIGTLPWFIPHSDETRIQNIPEIIEEFAGYPYYITTKMDGSSHAIGLDENDEFFVCGHNYRYADDGKSSFYEYVKKNHFEEKLKTYKAKHPQIGQIAVVGEYCGPGIQKNRLKLNKPEWYVFTVEINGHRTGMTETMYCVQEIGARMVPIEETQYDFSKSLEIAYPSVKDLLKRAEGQYPNGGAKEGIVVRTCEPMTGKDGEYLSFKVINNKYLLKEN